MCVPLRGGFSHLMTLLLFKYSAGHQKNREFSCVCLHGDRKPQERKGNLEKFKVMKCHCDKPGLSALNAACSRLLKLSKPWPPVAPGGYEIARVDDF